MTVDRQMQGNTQAQTVAMPKRLPLIIEPENRNDSTAKDAKLVNGYVERNQKTGETWIFKRPGLVQTLTTKTGNGLGVFYWNDEVYSIFGASLWRNNTDTTSVLDTTGGVYRFTSNIINELVNGSSIKLVFNTAVAGYGMSYPIPATQITARTSIPAGSFVVGQTYTIEALGTTNFIAIGSIFNLVGWIFTATGVGAGTGSAWLNTNYPYNAVKGIVYLDGLFYVTSVNSSVRGSSTLNDPYTWADPLNRLTAQIEPESAVCTAKQLSYVIVFKQYSTEVFYDQRNATASALGPVQGAKINFGCVSADSVRELDGSLCWLSQNRSGSVQVMVMEALKPVIVSTKPIERMLDAMNFTTVFSFAFKYNGHKFYGFTSKVSNITLVYDLVDQFWSQWTDTDGNYWPMVSATFNATQDTILQHETNGKLYKFDAGTYLDDGALFSFQVVTPNFDGGTGRRKTLAVLAFVGDRVAGSILQVRSNDADYDSTKWTNFRYMDLDAKRPLLSNCGTFVKRAYEFTHRSNTPLRMQALELQLDLGVL